VTELPPLRREIVVETDPDHAFVVFTEHMGRWWPVEGHSLYGAGATVELTDGQIIERSPDGAAAIWGTITRWEPGQAVGFTWHPGRSADQPSQVEVSFSAIGARTRVVLEHSGWEVFGNPSGVRAEYEKGWPVVLDRYRDDAGQRPGNDEAETHTWVALLHTPGPDAPADGNVFEDPRFAEHVAFLHRLQAAGYLVAAGPFGDQLGHGMAVLRLPGGDQLEQAIQLATEDDKSVTGGLFQVTIRRWNVIMQGAVGSAAG
jgi:uncharacterized protein YciI